MEIFNSVIESPLFGIFITLAAYEIAVALYKKVKFVLFNPLLVSIIIVITFLSITGISYETYKYGAKYLSYFLTPVTVCLAVPLYKQMEILKKK